MFFYYRFTPTIPPIAPDINDIHIIISDEKLKINPVFDMLDIIYIIEI